MIVTMRHVREARYCARGARQFFKRHNLDWRAFIAHGIDEKELIATGDAMAQFVVEVAHGVKR